MSVPVKAGTPGVGWWQNIGIFYEDSESSPSLRTKTQRLKSESLKFQRLGL